MGDGKIMVLPAWETRGEEFSLAAISAAPASPAVANRSRR
jgi:hypothetical protein